MLGSLPSLLLENFSGGLPWGSVLASGQFGQSVTTPHTLYCSPLLSLVQSVHQPHLWVWDFQWCPVPVWLLVALLVRGLKLRMTCDTILMSLKSTPGVERH